MNGIVMFRATLIVFNLFLHTAAARAMDWSLAPDTTRSIASRLTRLDDRLNLYRTCKAVRNALKGHRREMSEPFYSLERSDDDDRKSLKSWKCLRTATEKDPTAWHRWLRVFVAEYYDVLLTWPDHQRYALFVAFAQHLRFCRPKGELI